MELKSDYFKEQLEKDCVDKDKLYTTVENLREIMNTISELRPFFEDGIKIHFPDSLTIKYDNEDLNEPINFRVFMRKMIQEIISHDDLPMTTISPQSKTHFRFFTKDFEVKVSCPEYLNDPIGNILGVNTDD
jgi:hypothetical protein